MKNLLAIVLTLFMGAALGSKPASSQSPGSITVHVEMQAVILSDNDGSNPPGVLTTAQLQQWVDKANQAYAASNAGWVIDFYPQLDIAYVKNSCLNRLNHNQNQAASALAAMYPGRMVVFFRAYSSPATGSACSGSNGPNGNGYTAYNPYVPLGSSNCQDINGPGCSASYVVMPSVYCATQVGIDFANSRNPGPSVPTSGNDTSGCPIFVQPGTGLIFIQNFDQLAHEVGHYFGLPHTFPGPSDQLTKPGILQSWYNGPPRSGTTRSIQLFDGDASTGPEQNGGYTGWSFTVNDTPPDAGAQLYVSNGVNMCNTPTGKTISDGSGATVVFNGDSYTLHGKDENNQPLSLTFWPAKGNVMSYFACKNPMLLKGDQVSTMWNVILHDPNREYLLCYDPNDAAFKPYITCP